MTRKLILALLILLQAGCSSLTPPASSPTPSLTPLPPPSPTRTFTPAPTATATRVPEVDLGDISLLVALDGFTVSVPYPYLHEVQNNVIIISDEERSLTISFAGDAYDASQSLTDVIERYLASLEQRGGNFETSEPAAISINGVEGISVDVKGKIGDVPLQGMAVAVSPSADFVLFGLATSNLGSDAAIWETQHRAVFEAFLKRIEFVDAGVACPVSSDPTYGYSETNPIQVGGDIFEGPSRAQAYLNHLRGPNGEALTYEREGSFPGNDTILDAYRITGPGIDEVLYVDQYNFSPPQAPVGFTCSGAFPLSQP
ncbi:MAG: hypothetical protein DPW18_01215 [Chloroflexi bacterium]|nr:hypothetical protein [Chloroflexota bacterium]MDL1940874.1 hypothetical protein [Chloroflexi bacterium CFX2]